MKLGGKRIATSDGRAIVGLIAWLLFVLFAPHSSEGLLQTIENLVLLATLIHLPLAIGLLYHPSDPIWGSDPLHFAQRFQPLAALSLLISLSLPKGGVAFLLALPWLAITASMALSALSWLTHNRWRINHQLVFCAGLLYLPIGAVWLAAYRLGLRPLGFADVIVVLTAVHFHYSGFVLPVFTGMVGRWVTECQVRNSLYPWIALGVIVATPLIAAGITLSPMVEIVGVAVMFCNAAGLLFVVIQTALPLLQIRLVRELLRISAFSLLLAVGLAILYGTGEFLGQPWLTIPQMVSYHGWLNSVGFALCGLLGWRLLFPPAEGDGSVLLEQTW
ncbi:MAG: YndJ family protein [Caldilineaceae bacterium]